MSNAAQGPANIANGRTVYDAACGFCHGDTGEGGHGGGPVLTAVESAAAVSRIVADGRNDMPAFGGALTPEQIRDVGVFVAAQLAGRPPGPIPGGRPPGAAGGAGAPVEADGQRPSPASGPPAAPAAQP